MAQTGHRLISRLEATAMQVDAWGPIAAARASHLDEGRDISYSEVIVPAILDLLPRQGVTHLLDVGCGTGRLTRLLAGRADRVTGIEPNSDSYELARACVANVPNVAIEHSTVETYRPIGVLPADAAVVNMVLQDVVDLDGICMHLRRLLSPQGSLVVSITHPAFWPRYWGYDKEDWFHYEKELFIRSPFRTSSAVYNGFETMHVHRPLEVYLRTFRDAGFELDRFLEPMLESTVGARVWEYPHFAFFALRRER